MVAIDDALDISASPEQVWAALTDFSGYRQWNPFITHAKGAAKEGENVEIKFKPFQDREKVVTVRLTLVKESAEIRWTTWLTPGLLKWEHTLHVERFEGGHVCIVQRAVFSGMMANRVKGKIQEHMRSGFAAMNHALKERVESGVPATHGRGYVN